MKKICAQSLIIGIGMGMIITASFNYLWEGKNISNEITQDIVGTQAGIEKSIGDIKKDLDIKKEKPEDGMQNQKNVDNNNRDEEAEEVKEKIISNKRIIISSGMNTNSIGKFLFSQGLISDIDEFINMAQDKNYTRKFIAGPKLIPEDSSLEELLEILINR